MVINKRLYFLWNYCRYRCTIEAFFKCYFDSKILHTACSPLTALSFHKDIEVQKTGNNLYGYVFDILVYLYTLHDLIL